MVAEDAFGEKGVMALLSRHINALSLPLTEHVVYQSLLIL